MWTRRVVSSTIWIAGLLLTLSFGLAAVAAKKRRSLYCPTAAHIIPGRKGRTADVTELLSTSAQTGGVLGLFRQIIAPQSGPPAHIHRDADEFFYVVSGTFDFKLGDRIVNVTTGSVVFIPKGTVHTFENKGTQPAILLVEVTPAGLEQKFADWQGGDEETVKAMNKKYYTDVVGPPLK